MALGIMTRAQQRKNINKYVIKEIYSNDINPHFLSNDNHERECISCVCMCESTVERG